MEIDTLIFKYVDLLLLFLIVSSIFIFIFWPIISVIFKSFVLDGKLNFSEFDNLFKGNKKLIIDSVLVSSLTTIITIIISVSLSLYERYSSNKIKKIILPILFLTMISPPFVSSFAYINLFGRRGFITYKLLKLSVNPYGWHGVVMMQAVSEISLASIIIIGVLKGIDKNLINASRDLGAKSIETIRRVVLPKAFGGILAAGFITFVKALADFGTPIIIGGKFKFLATEAYLTIIGRGNLPRASAMSVLILIPSFIAFLFYRIYMKDFHMFSDNGSKESESGDIDLEINGVLDLFLGIFAWGFITIMVLQYISIFTSAVTYFNGSNYVFTLKHIKGMKGGKWTSFFRSIRYSFIAAIATGLIGLLLSYYIERRKFFGSKVVDFLSSLPYIIPGTFFGIGYILAFNKPPLKLTGTGIIVILNCIFRQIPIGTKAGSAALANVSMDIENAARDLGVPKIFVIKDIILPLLKPAFIVTFINTFTTTMTTVGAIIFIISPSAKVATVEMFSTLSNGDYGIGAVIASLIIISTLIINLSFSYMINRKEKLSR